MKIPKLAILFILVVGTVAYLTYIRRPQILKETISKPQYPHSRTDPTNLSTDRFQYGIMIDAGSTGTRIHIFQFLLEENATHKLARETFRAIKPGLSAYVDDPEKCTDGIQELLEVAQESVPSSQWNITPLVLKATAGLRLLPGEKAQQLLDKVREVFDESPFLSRHDSVSIMEGTEEGISAWITINFLTGGLQGGDGATVGMLDLGGGSTQITFSPQDEKSIQTSPIDYITSFQMFNRTHTLYSHSYLGLGLMSARLAVLGGVEGQPQGSTELVSPCLAPDSTEHWEHAEVDYTVKGQKAGEPIYESCYSKVEKALYKKVQKAEEAEDAHFYAFSYYYDRAVDIGAIAEKDGGTIKVNDYIEAAKKVCNSIAETPPTHPFLCLDLTYISVLLQELGFPKDKELKLAKKINNVETSWALGATFHYMELHSRD
ncbi:ectonucleoside triphosphate diphosphohydrolase 6 isoform X2 [Conger conger]|uniref:ectonucleoside triphosphate diphosphohydrolase 6 isoform X2 n=1 Tax=Conger conger TaxID=82655 RepID=UPI002A5A2D7D|nr:ectonucleoside triphosphate diphosphohydrolase 6 isoform X2 [Conger conger]